MRMRKKPWAEAELSANSLIIQNPAEFRGKWREVFGNDGGINLEIGMGKGKFIIEKAAANPFENYIGIERQISVLAVAAKRIGSALNNGNIRAALADAAAITEIFAEGEASELYINFCDPWPKRRCEKRRLTHSSFLKRYAQVLKPGGKVVFKTDNRDLFDFSLNEFKNNGWSLEGVSYDLHKDISALDGCANITTEYEDKFAERGMSIYRIITAPAARSQS